MTTEHEKEMIEGMLAKTNIKAGDVFVDIGANIGQELQYLAPLGVTVYSYEPHPIFYNMIHNLYGNLPNVSIKEMAVSNYNGEANLFCKKSETAINGGPSIKHKFNCLPVPSYKVKVIKITDIIKPILEKHGTIKVLKIDTEGSEFDILKDLMESDIDLSKIEYLYMEDHYGEIGNEDYYTTRDFVIDNWPKTNGPKIRGW